MSDQILPEKNWETRADVKPQGLGRGDVCGTLGEPMGRGHRGRVWCGTIRFGSMLGVQDCLLLRNVRDEQVF